MSSALNALLNLLSRTEGRDKVNIKLYRFSDLYNLLVFVHFKVQLKEQHQLIKFMNKYE